MKKHFCLQNLQQKRLRRETAINWIIVVDKKVGKKTGQNPNEDPCKNGQIAPLPPSLYYLVLGE